MDRKFDCWHKYKSMDIGRGKDKTDCQMVCLIKSDLKKKITSMKQNID